MKIESQEKYAKLNGLHKSSDVCKIHISSDKLLRIIKSKDIPISKYIIYLNGKLYIRDGARWYPNEDSSYKDVPVCVKTASKIAFIKNDGALEYITPKKEASEDFRFLLYAVHRYSLMLIFVDGSVSSRWFLRTIENTEENSEFYEAIVEVMLNKFDSNAAKVYDEFFEGKLENEKGYV